MPLEPLRRGSVQKARTTSHDDNSIDHYKASTCTGDQEHPFMQKCARHALDRQEQEAHNLEVVFTIDARPQAGDESDQQKMKAYRNGVVKIGATKHPCKVCDRVCKQCENGMLICNMYFDDRL